jgi:hypothetical protein
MLIELGTMEMNPALACVVKDEVQNGIACRA